MRVEERKDEREIHLQYTADYMSVLVYQTRWILSCTILTERVIIAIEEEEEEGGGDQRDALTYFAVYCMH